MKSLTYLYWQWLHRDVAGRYRGSMLGVVWPVLQPTIQILVFTLIFYQFMHMRWPAAQAHNGALVYGVNVFAGMIAFNFFAEILTRSPTAVLSQANLVTKVRFPLLLLPLVTVGSALTHLMVGGTLLLIVAALTLGISWTLLLIPVYAVPVLAYGVALAVLLSSLGVYLRDIGQIMPSIVSLLMFLTPIFYPASAIPESLHFAFGLNPIAWAVEVSRALIIEHQTPSLLPYLMHLAVSALCVWIAVQLFRRISKGFADVI